MLQIPKVPKTKAGQWLGLLAVTVGAAMVCLTNDPAFAQIADAGESLLEELSEYGPSIAGVGIIVCGVGMIASLQGALYAGVPMIIGGSVVSLVDDIMSMLGWG